MLQLLRSKRKKIGSLHECAEWSENMNPLLRDRALSVSWQNPWKILADFPMPVAIGDDNFASCSEWLRLYDEIRTFYQSRSD